MKIQRRREKTYLTVRCLLQEEGKSSIQKWQSIKSGLYSTLVTVWPTVWERPLSWLLDRRTSISKTSCIQQCMYLIFSYIVSKYMVSVLVRTYFCIENKNSFGIPTSNSISPNLRVCFLLKNTTSRKFGSIVCIKQLRHSNRWAWRQ